MGSTEQAYTLPKERSGANGDSAGTPRPGPAEGRRQTWTVRLSASGKRVGTVEANGYEEAFARAVVLASETGHAPQRLDLQLRDADLGRMLGYDPPEKIRELIHQMVATGEIDPVRSSSRDSVSGYLEYCLTQTEFLTLCFLSDAPRAKEVRKSMISVIAGTRSDPWCLIGKTCE